METVTLSSKYQLVLPRGARKRLKLRPGMRITVLDKGGVIFLVPERPLRAYRGIARGVKTQRAPRQEGPPLILVDSSCWIEYLAGRPNADRFAS